MSAPRIASVAVEWEDRDGRKCSFQSEIDVREVHDLIGWVTGRARDAVLTILSAGLPPRRGTIKITASLPIGRDLTLDVLAADVPADGDILLVELPIPDGPYDEEEAAAAARRKQAASARPAARRREGRDAG